MELLTKYRPERPKKEPWRFSEHKYKFYITGIILFIISVLRFMTMGIPSLYAPNFSSYPSVQYFDLAHYDGSEDGWQREERVLFCVPLRDAAAHLPMFLAT